MKPFCDIDAYQRRYGFSDTIDYMLLNECLLDASYKIVAELQLHGIDWKHEKQRDREYGHRLMQVCRDMAHRAMASDNLPDIPLGATQFQQSADGFSAMASFNSGGGFGELYLTRSDKKLLGIGGSPKMFSIQPEGLKRFAKKTRYGC